MNYSSGNDIAGLSRQAPILEGMELKVLRAGFTVLDVAHLSLREGETLALIGPNGAGKTTLLVTLCCLTKGFSGRILFHGRRVGDEVSEGEYRRCLAMVFQEPLLFDTTVFHNVASGLKFRKFDNARVKKVVGENLERFGITHLRDRSARMLSGGEAQRVSLARAFALSPEVLFLDEPFSALDQPSRESLIDDFERARKASRTTTVFATHDRLEALRLSDRIAVMNNGTVVQEGFPDEVMNTPADEFVASFVGVETIFRGRVVKRKDGALTVSVSNREIEVVGRYEPGDEVVLCIRPENVVLSMDSMGTQNSARNNFAGVIEKIVPLGLYYKITLNCGFVLTAYVTGHSCESMTLVPGKQITASFKATAVHVLKRGN